MSNIKTVRVGIMPGRISEFAVEEGAHISDVLELAGLDATGYEVKVDGTKVNLSASQENYVTASTNLILLAKVVKGNASKTVRVGMMPGRISEYAVDSQDSIASVLELAGLNADGYEVKADGSKVTDLSQPVGTANLILLAKQVKGNAAVRIGMMPGRINEFALEDSTTFRKALEIAELDPSGYEVKADGSKVDNLDAPIGSTNLILLAKQVKGNK